MNRFTRRTFLKATAAATATFPLFTVAGTQASGRRVIGANDAVRVGVAGINGQGGAHINQLANVKDVQVTYLIDPDSRLFEPRGNRVKELFGSPPKCVKNIREALSDPNLDAISIATCNHWHSLMTVWACQHEKHVYVEKPISHNVHEGRRCVEEAEKYGCVVQHGTQQRSDLGRAREIAAVQSGKYGKLLVSKGYCCKPRWSIGVKPIGPAPDGFDFNLWLGPAPEQPFHGNLHPYNWHWFWDFGNGDIGNQGVHEMDVARWAIKDATLPTRVWSLGGRFIPQEPDQGETPNMELSVYEFGETLLVFETRGLVAKGDAPPFKVANEYYTTEGKITNGKFYPKNGGDAEPVSGDATVTPGGPFGSFIAAIRNGNPQMSNCGAEVAHYSAALCHLGNISYRLGEPVPFRDKPKLLGDNAQVVESFEAVCENLRAVSFKLEETTYQLGRVLEFDSKAERFVGDDEANALLTRPYRKGFDIDAAV